MVEAGLIGRDAEFGRLSSARSAAEDGSGSLVLVSGDAGVGKTALCELVARGGRGLVIRGVAAANALTPYSPIVGALRAYLRSTPAALDDCPLRGNLALLLPEL